MKNNNGLLYHFFYLLLTKSSVKHVISYISKTLKPNQTKPNQTQLHFSRFLFGEIFHNLLKI